MVADKEMTSWDIVREPNRIIGWMNTAPGWSC